MKPLDQLLETVTPREAYVIRRRHFSPDDPTLAAVGVELEVSKERIRQIEAKALRKIRHPTRRHLLKPVLDALEGPDFEALVFWGRKPK